MCHHRGGLHEIESVAYTGEIQHLTTARGPAASLVRTPTAVLVLEAVQTETGTDIDIRTRIARLEPSGLVVIGEVADRAVGAAALDTQGRLLAVNVVRPGQGGEAVEFDLLTGTSRPLLSVRPTSEDRVLDHSNGLVVVSTTAWGESRLGYGRPGSHPVRFPDELTAPGGASHLATSPDGARVAVALEHGAVTQIRILDTITGHVITPSLPPLVVIGRGHLGLGDGRLTVPVSTPDHPGTLLNLDLNTGAYAFDDPAASDPVRLRVVSVDGAAGPIECVVLGNPDTASTVVVALHGGPLGAWRTHHDPMLAGLAAAGIAVLAPNVRGSTGYGDAHALAIRDQWGGPDLDDVLAIAAALRARRADRPLPVILGHSYGAWLALLAAAAEADAWGGCVAISAFASGRRVVDAGGPVAELVTRLGGLSGPDAAAAAARVATPTLVLHGTHDTVVTASEGRRLAEALPPGVGHLIELPGCGHDVFTSHWCQEALDAIVAFSRQNSRLRPLARPTTSTERR